LFADALAFFEEVYKYFKFKTGCERATHSQTMNSPFNIYYLGRVYNFTTLLYREFEKFAL